MCLCGHNALHFLFPTDIFHHMLSLSYIRSFDWRHGKEVLRFQEVHASWLDGWSKVSVLYHLYDLTHFTCINIFKVK